MIRARINKRSILKINDCVEGEMLETKIERIVNNSEPITDGAPLIYGERKDGVQASQNIRTDRFEVAIDATEKIAKSYKARREDKADMKVVKPDMKTDEKSGESDGKAESI